EYRAVALLHDLAEREVATVVADAAAQHAVARAAGPALGGDAEPREQAEQPGVGFVDRLATQLGAQTTRERHAVLAAVRRVNAAAHARPALQHDDLPPRIAQRERRRQPGQACPGDDDAPRRARIGARSEVDAGHARHNASVRAGPHHSVETGAA